jgi:hypothetical protein
MLLDRLLSFFTSLRLTVFCLACALVLVFAGTLAQIHLGLYVTQTRYFHSLLVFWTPEGTNWKIPVWPGGYLIGGTLLINLIAAHIKRFTFTWKKSGLFLIHGGLILLFLGQFFTEVFQIESFMRIEEGETKNFAESARRNELAIVDVTDPNQDRVVIVPEAIVSRKGEIKDPSLPFTIKVSEYASNSRPAPAMASVAGDMHRIQATQGVGQRLSFRAAPVTYRSDDDNVSIALVDIQSPAGSLGSWTVSTWFNKDLVYLRQLIGDQFASMARAPQQFTYANRTYRIALRPVRYYKPYNLTLLKFNHKIYKGTDIPKDFSSRVRVQNPQTAEDREVLIYMNNPLRYAGETFYQGGFEQGDTVSILQVVRNPAWLTPYLSCTLVGVGLTVHFLMHLISFGKKRALNGKPPSVEPRSRRPKARRESEPEAAAVALGSNLRRSLDAIKRRST